MSDEDSREIHYFVPCLTDDQKSKGTIRIKEITYKQIITIRKDLNPYEELENLVLASDDINAMRDVVKKYNLDINYEEVLKTVCLRNKLTSISPIK